MSNLEFYNSYELSSGYIVKFLFDDNLSIIYQKQNLDEKSVYNIYNNIIELNNGNLVFAGIQDTSFIKTKPFDLMGKILLLDKDCNLIKKRYYSTNDINDNNGNLSALYSFFQTSDKGYIAAYYHQATTAPGKFMVVKYDSTGCDSTVAFCGAVGIKVSEIEKNNLNIYPIPTNDALYIEQHDTNLPSKANYFITNSLGQAVLNNQITFENGKARIYLKNLPAGLYTIKFKFDNLTSTNYKIIKQ